jgi:lysophospholipase L1-like esterase
VLALAGIMAFGGAPRMVSRADNDATAAASTETNDIAGNGTENETAAVVEAGIKTAVEGTSESGTEAVTETTSGTETEAVTETAAVTEAATEAVPGRTPTLWVVGDSTAAEFNDNYYYPRYGWGTQLYRYFTGINIRNLAVSGTSSKSYVNTSAYEILLDGIEEGDYVIIGFGHNDEKAESARYTNPNGTVSTPGSTQYCLYENFIKPAQEKGATPVVCTPIVRRDPGNNYNGASAHIIAAQTTIEGTFEGGNYAKAIRNAGVGKSATVVDLTARTKDLYERMGAQGIRFHHAYSSPDENSIDNTHTSILGAAYNAYFIADELLKSGCSLKNYVIDNPTPPDDSILEPNPNYQWKTFTAPTGSSSHWTDAGDWKATVFGDIGQYEYLNDIYFHFDPYEDGSMRIAAGRQGGSNSDIVGASVGKIASATDGIAMYYQAVPANRNFTLSADVTINSIDANNQASFGLMVRDDIYLDEVTSETLGDYVAAAPLMMGSSDIWNCFARKSGVLTRGGKTDKHYQAGDTIHLEITKTSDGYTCTLGDNAPVSAGFDFPLTTVDSSNVYVGMFAARSVDVVFSNVNLQLQ